MENEIKRLLLSKLEKIENFYEHTQNIHKTLEEEDTEKLLGLFNARQQLIEDIDQIDSRLLLFFDGNFNELSKYIIKGDEALIKIYNNILTFLKKIRKYDDENIIGTRKLLSKIKGDISHLKQAGNALKGYGIIGKSSHDGAFIDTKK